MDTISILQELHAISKELSQLSSRLQLIEEELGHQAEDVERLSEADKRLAAAAANLLEDYQPGSEHIVFTESGVDEFYEEG